MNQALSSLRILYIIDEMEAITAGGTERQILQMIRLMTEAGADVHLCVLRGTAWLNEENAGCPIRFAGVSSFFSFAGILSLWRLFRWMRSMRFQVVQTFFVESNIAGPIVARFAGVPVVLGSRRNLNYWMSGEANVLQRFSNLFATRLVANCNAVKECIVRTEGVSADKVDVIYNGVDTEMFAPNAQDRVRVREELGFSADRFVFGMVSTLRPVKGVEFFIQAAAMMHADNPLARFVVIGDGPSRPTFEAMIHDGNLDGCFVLLGSREIVHPYLQAFDVAVLSSESEGFSNSILEYISAALPCIASDAGGNAEAVGNAGIVVPAGDVQALASAMRLLQADSDLRKSLSATALAQAHGYSLHSTKANLILYYQSLMSH